LGKDDLNGLKNHEKSLPECIEGDKMSNLRVKKSLGGKNSKEYRNQQKKLRRLLERLNQEGKKKYKKGFFGPKDLRI